MSIPALLPDPSSSGLTAHRCLCPAEQPGKQSTAAPWERAGTGPLSRAGSGRGKLRAAGTVRAPGRSGRGGGSHSPACSSEHSPVAPTHLLALVCRQPVGQEGAESALAHAALAGQNQHHVLHAPQPLPQRRRLRCGVARPQSATTGPGPAPARLAPPPARPSPAPSRPPSPGSGPAAPAAHSFWLGHPWQAAARPAWTLPVPGQSATDKESWGAGTGGGHSPSPPAAPLTLRLRPARRVRHGAHRTSHPPGAAGAVLQRGACAGGRS